MTKLPQTDPNKGFTLIELLIVIGIIGFLAAAVLVAVDPVKRIQDARDARRYSEANAILNAILTKQVDDRALYSGTALAPIITSATNSQVIVNSDVGIACGTAVASANYPGCNQVLDTSAGSAIAGTATSSGTAVTGVGTAFTTALKVGDVIYSTSPNFCTVASITSDLALTCLVAPAGAFAGALTRASKNCVANLSDTLTGPGTATSAAAVVTGTNSSFTTWVAVGDTLTSASGGTCTVTVVTNNTSITCSATPSTPFAGTYTILKKNPFVPTYIASLPIDPIGSGSTICSTGSGCTTLATGITALGTTNTGYYLHRTNGNRIEVGACAPEQLFSAGINVKR